MNESEQVRPCNKCGLTVGFRVNENGTRRLRCQRYDPTTVDRYCGGWMLPDPNTVSDPGMVEHFRNRSGYVGD